MPGKLILTLNKSVLGEFPLDKERILLGRRPDNDIQVDNLAVSGQHAAIITILNDSFLEDLDSTNGTYVNGKLIKKHALKHGDVIQIGKHELRYVNEDAAEEEDDFEKTMIIRPGMAAHATAAAKAREAPPPAPPAEGGAPGAAAATAGARGGDDVQAAAAPAAAAGGAELPLGRILVLNGPAAGKELKLTKAMITLGRPGVQVAVITRRPQGYFITHVEGKHPVVNGDSIGAQARPLKDNDVVELAGVKMEFQLVS